MQTDRSVGTLIDVGRPMRVGDEARRLMVGTRDVSSDDDFTSSREKIVEVAEVLFARSGYSGVGMREVAERVGLRKSTLFHHFRSKPALYFEVSRRVLIRIEERVSAAVERAADPMARLEAWLVALVDALAEHPPAARLLLRGLFEDHEAIDPEGEREETEATLAALIGRFQCLLRDGIDAGAFRPVSLRDATQTMIGATVYHFASGEFGEQVMGESLFSARAVARRKQELIEFARRGLAAGPSATPASNWPGPASN